VRAGDDRALGDALARGADPDAADADGATALMWAAHDGRLGAVRALVASGATVNGVRGAIWIGEERTGFYGGVLAAAAGRGHLDVVRYLVEEAGADVNAGEWDPRLGAFGEWTSLRWATYGGHEEVVQVLLAAGAAPLSPEPAGDGVYELVQVMPELQGGMAALQRRILYPEAARRRGIEGRVFVRFVVDQRGMPGDIQVVRGIGGGCDEAAAQAVGESRFTPGYQDGRPVKVRMSLPVTFRLTDPPLPPPIRGGGY
jgi:TonB family protein